jgi:hypothetical protein
MRVSAIAAAVTLGLLAAFGARGDIPPLPGEQERMFFNLIESAGHRCGKVGSYTAGTGSQADDYTSRELDAFVVSCINGKSYLVAVPRRRHGPPILDPSGQPVPYPDPVVKEIEK